MGATVTFGMIEVGVTCDICGVAYSTPITVHQYVDALNGGRGCGHWLNAVLPKGWYVAVVLDVGGESPTTRRRVCCPVCLKR